MQRKKNPYTLFVGILISGNQNGGSLGNKYRTIPLLGIYPKEYKSIYNRDICTPMFITALFMIAKLWTSPGAYDWIKKMWYIYTIEYYSAIKSEMFAGKSMELKIIMLTKNKSSTERQI
jgi:hypothetical protein